MFRKEKPPGAAATAVGADPDPREKLLVGVAAAPNTKPGFAVAMLAKGEDAGAAGAAWPGCLIKCAQVVERRVLNRVGGLSKLCINPRDEIKKPDLKRATQVVIFRTLDYRRAFYV